MRSTTPTASAPKKATATVAHHSPNHTAGPETTDSPHKNRYSFEAHRTYDWLHTCIPSAGNGNKDEGKTEIVEAEGRPLR